MDKKQVTAVMEQVIEVMHKKYGINRESMAHGYCDLFSVEAKKLLPSAVIVTTDYGNLIDEHQMLKVGALYYDAQDTQGVSSPEQLKYFKRDFGKLRVPASYAPKMWAKTYTRIPETASDSWTAKFRRLS